MRAIENFFQNEIEKGVECAATRAAAASRAPPRPDSSRAAAPHSWAATL